MASAATGTFCTLEANVELVEYWSSRAVCPPPFVQLRLICDDDVAVAAKPVGTPGRLGRVVTGSTVELGEGPPALVARRRKWYVVLAESPVMGWLVAPPAGLSVVTPEPNVLSVEYSSV